MLVGWVGSFPNPESSQQPTTLCPASTTQCFPSNIRLASISPIPIHLSPLSSHFPNSGLPLSLNSLQFEKKMPPHKKLIFFLFYREVIWINNYKF
jgi:hypothetical protein